MVLIVGAPRSGTTLLTQWFAESNAFAVPSNLLARFFRAPYLGGLIQRLLTDPQLAYLDELSTGTEVTGSYKSTIGKTSGILAPHEFSYFWRQYFPVGPCEHLSQESWANSDHVGFTAGLAALEAGLGRPLAMKGLILQYNITQLAALLPNAIFVHTRRDEVANVDSLVNARRTVSSESDWFSVRPPGSELVDDASPLEQVSAQVAWTNDWIVGEFAEIPERQRVTVDHEAFCSDQSYLWGALRDRMADLGHEIGAAPQPRNFEVSVRLPADAATYRATLEAMRELLRNGSRQP
jgi:hypothetical protein